MAKPLTHTHQIRVETDEEHVTLMIGGDGGIPGGFAKLFNRVVDSQAWANLSDAARAAYLPLVRFADHRNHFRVSIGQAGLMKYSGLSRSSVKRAVKDLVASKLVVLVEQGGVSADGQNEANLYQLMVPVEPRTRREAVGAAGVGPAANPPPVQMRTPSRPPVEPPAGPVSDPGPVRPATRTGVRAAQPPRSANGPQYRRTISEENRQPDHNGLGSPAARTPTEDAVALLEEKGVQSAAARELAAGFPYERVVDVVATMEYRKARGKCDNPGGFIREALLKQWQTPRAVVEARRQAEARLRQQDLDREARASRAAEASTAHDDERRVERLIDGLDDDELAILAESVLAKHEGNAAVLQVLTRKPPRQCRLMKMEIAAMLGGAGAR